MVCDCRPNPQGDGDSASDHIRKAWEEETCIARVINAFVYTTIIEESFE